MVAFHFCWHFSRKFQSPMQILLVFPVDQICRMLCKCLLSCGSCIASLLTIDDVSTFLQRPDFGLVSLESQDEIVKCFSSLSASAATNVKTFTIYRETVTLRCVHRDSWLRFLALFRIRFTFGNRLLHKYDNWELKSNTSHVLTFVDIKGLISSSFAFCICRPVLWYETVSLLF